MNPKSWLKTQLGIASNIARLGIFLHVLHALLAIVQAGMLALILYQVIFEDQTLAHSIKGIIVLFLIFLARAIIALAAERCSVKAAANIRLSLRSRLYRHILALGPAYLSAHPSGSLLEILNKGIDDLEDYYARFFPVFISVMVVPLAILVVLLPLDWVSALLLVVTLPLIPVTMIVVGKKAARKNQELWERLTRMGAHFLDVIQGLTTLKMFSASKREIQVIAKISNDYRINTMQVLRFAFLSSAVLELFATVGIALVAIFVGVRLYGEWLSLPTWLHVPQPGYLQAIFILLLIPEFYLPLRNFGIQYHTRMGAVAAAEKLIEILDEPLPKQVDKPLVLANTEQITIEFQNLSYQYEAGREALANISCTMPAGTRTALIGASGAGKSTLLSLLLGFIQPQTGHILVNGLDLTQVDQQSWGKLLTWIPQQPRLFVGTIAENIALGQPHATMESIQHAAELAFADGFIQKLPHAYDYRIGEFGSGLSGGQIQRIALARAFLHDTPILLMDEPTASLDPESEALVQRAIDQLSLGKTVISVAHRLVTVEQADQILVMDNGRIIEQGTDSSLRHANGAYVRLLADLNTPPLNLPHYDG